MDLQAYLRRINYRGEQTPSVATLHDLHLAHLLAVPFENLDIHLGRSILLDQDALFDKIVTRRRGGFCYELNGLFALLLRDLGFDVTLLAAGVARADGGFGPEFDHLTLLVASPLSVISGQLHQPPEANVQPSTGHLPSPISHLPSPISHLPSPIWLADVGFGDSFRAPLRFVEGVEQDQDGRAYRLDRAGEHYTLMQRNAEGWQPQYRFTLQPRAWAEYADMCRYHQTSPESSFTRKRVCTLATPDGRVTLSDHTLIVTARGQRTEQLLPDQPAFQAALHEHFGIDLAISI
jgi:N-hydroxyarylamine O-acetyltransferase